MLAVRHRGESHAADPWTGLAGPAPARFRTPPVVEAKTRPERARGLLRPRLVDLLGRGLWQRQLTVIVAPAGSGKTTLLAQFAQASNVPVAWYRAEASDATRSGLLAYLEATLTKALPRLRGGWGSLEDAARALEGPGIPQALLIIDDLHTLQGTPAEAAWEQFLRYAPPSLAIMAASRTSPGLQILPAMRLAREVLELGADDLRFRTWEVERLFSELYANPLGPEEAGELTRRTEGWAAGLQMFHLTTAGKTRTQRGLTLAGLGVHSRLAREYLARNVLDDLPGALRSFLLGTCVLSRLSGPLCDQMLGSSNSEAALRELERRQVFTVAVEDTGWYRYHEALRSHLEGLMLEEVGGGEARRRYLQAAGILEGAGALTDALQAYCRGEDWESVQRLLGAEGSQVAMERTDWLTLLPPSIATQDPWVLLATARRLRACGRWEDAIGSYRAAEQIFGAQAGVESCVTERMALAAWLESSPTTHDWIGLLRSAVTSAPLRSAEMAAEIPGPLGRLSAGLANLLAGNLAAARSHLAAAAAALEASPELAAGARLGGAIAGLLAGDPGSDAAGLDAQMQADAASEEADRLGLPWLARLARAALALSNRAEGRSEAAAARLACETQGDVWGASLAGLFEGFGALRAGGGQAPGLEQAAGGFAQLGATTLEAWCHSVRALILAKEGDTRAGEVGLLAERCARSAGVRGPLAYAYQALAIADPEHAASHAALAAAIAADLGLGLPQTAGTPEATAVADAVTVQCFGRFRFEVGSHLIDVRMVKPRVRKLLHMLALQAGNPIHRDVLIAALWPEADPEAGARNLHVAVSSLRQLLHDAPSRGVDLLREGDGYHLRLPPGARVDVADFSAALLRGRACKALGDAAGAVRALSGALQSYAGDLLAEDGPAEWLLADRERFRSEAVEAARLLADLLLAEGDAGTAITACERGLAVDRNRDDLWRILLQAHGVAGNHAAAADVRLRYLQVLAELGINPAYAGIPVTPSGWP